MIKPGYKWVLNSWKLLLLVTVALKMSVFSAFNVLDGEDS